MAWYAARMTRTYASLLNMGEGFDMFPQLGPLFSVPHLEHDFVSRPPEKSGTNSALSPGVGLRLWIELLVLSCCGLAYFVRASRCLVPAGKRGFTPSSTLFKEPAAGCDDGDDLERHEVVTP